MLRLDARRVEAGGARMKYVLFVCTLHAEVCEPLAS
jgi:hypothetical protein